VLLLDLAFAHRSRQQRIANQKARSLIKADHWIGRIIWQCVERKYLFQTCQKRCVDRANASGLAQVRLQFFF
jgi:hypothetical protein